ncbi:hypothetical protein ACFV7Q_27165 [Streptomyces sp. NPDC059851]|uniref:hypothetical protein n=1 Tax=Streptomyces sp. NPDC059851 TaxID=3346971 RepID=UPI003653918C
MSLGSMLLRNLLLLAVECGAVLLLRGPAPWIPVLLTVFVVGSGVLHGTDAEFTPRFAVALAAVGVTELTVRAWGPPDPRAIAAGVGAVVLLAVQTATVARYARRPRRLRRRRT